MFCSRFSQLRERRFLLFLGRIHEKKNRDLLLEAFADKMESALDCDVVVAGLDCRGPCGTGGRRFIDEHVDAAAGLTELPLRERDEMTSRAMLIPFAGFNIDRAVTTINMLFGSDVAEVNRPSV